MLIIGSALLNGKPICSDAALHPPLHIDHLLQSAQYEGTLVFHSPTYSDETNDFAESLKMFPITWGEWLHIRTFPL
jgi:hypothetical protein